MRSLLAASLAALALAGCAPTSGYRSADAVRAAYRIDDPGERGRALRAVRRADSLRAQREISAEDRAWLVTFSQRQALLQRAAPLREAAPVPLAVPEDLDVERTELVRWGDPRVTTGVVVHGRHRVTGERWVYVFDWEGRLRRAFLLNPVPEASGS